MALALTKPKAVTPAQYLALEEMATTKSEYCRGEIFMMAGGSPNHNRIAGNIFAEFNVGLRGRRCEAFNSDQRLHVKKNGLSDQIRIISIDLALSLDRIYERVEWESSRNEPN